MQNTVRNLIKEVAPPALLRMARAFFKSDSSPATHGLVAKSVSNNFEEMARRAADYGFDRQSFTRFMEDPRALEWWNKFNVYGAPKHINLPVDSKCFVVESLFEDAYFLEKIDLSKEESTGEVIKVVDIGANVGIFNLAARNKFKRATIHCYEPNQKLISNLSKSCYATNSKFYNEAVGLKDGRFSFDKRQSEILGHEHTMIMDFKSDGDVNCITLDQAFERIGAPVHLVKLDCEGSEWELLKNKTAWNNVKWLTMEYHRLSVDDSFDQTDLSVDIHEKGKAAVASIGFEIVASRVNSFDAGIILAKNKS